MGNQKKLDFTLEELSKTEVALVAKQDSWTLYLTDLIEHSRKLLRVKHEGSFTFLKHLLFVVDEYHKAKGTRSCVELVVLKKMIAAYVKDVIRGNFSPRQICQVQKMMKSLQQKTAFEL